MKQFENILFVVEEPVDKIDVAIARAVTLAQGNQATLTLLYVVERPRLGPFSDEMTQDEVESSVRGQALEKIERLLDPYREEVVIEVDVHFGVPFVEVVRDVLRYGRDLVIKAAGYGGAHDFLFGGTDQHLLRKCPCPVWILYGESSSNYQHVVAAVDFDPWNENPEEHALNRRILKMAASIALSDFAQLHVVHAWEPITDNMIRVFSSRLSEEQVASHLDRERHDQQALMDTLENRLRRELGAETYGYLAPRFHLHKGNPRTVIPDLAKELRADLVVMGTLSRTGILGFLIGNTAEVILNNLECSVLTVKPEGFVTPISLPEPE